MTKYKAAAFIMSLFFATSTFAEDFETFIVGGTPTPAHSAISKSMVMLRINNNSTCSGVAITKQHVLTAGHCVAKRPAANQIKVYSGSQKTLQPSVRYYFLHSGYRWEGSRLKGDLAILKMSNSFSSSVVPAPLFQSTIPDSAQLIAAGYGWTDANKTKNKELFQATYVWDRTAFFDRQTFSDGTRLIEYNSRQALCNGDSGGATFINTSQGLRTVGIHSMANCVNAGYDVYAPDHRYWIGQVLKYQ